MLAMDVPVIVQLEFQQSSFETVEVPQLQFLDRLPDIPVATQRQVLTVQTVQKTGDSTVQRVAADVPVRGFVLARVAPCRVMKVAQLDGRWAEMENFSVRINMSTYIRQNYLMSTCLPEASVNDRMH